MLAEGGKESGIGDGEGDSLNVDGNDVYVGCKDARADTHSAAMASVGRLEKGSPK